MNVKSKTLLISMGATVLSLIVEYFLKRYYKNKLEQCKTRQNKQDEFYYHSLFWTNENIKCKEHLFNNEECGSKCSLAYLQTLIKLVASAKFSISMCMYHLTLRQVTDELINAHERGVVVRIITDPITSKMEHSKAKLLKCKYGFDIRVPPYENSYMHHKYCVIDVENLNLEKVFFGSLNLTLQGCVANFEFVAITNNLKIVRRYWEEFNLLWNEFQVSNRICQ